MKNILPKGFYDYSGDEVLKREQVYQYLLKIADEYACEHVQVSTVGYAAEFLEFGTAAKERTFQFYDNHERKLMLCADSIRAILRLYKSKYTNGYPARFVGKVPVFRYRKKKYRNWEHLIISMVNVPSDVYVDYILVEMAYRFLHHYISNLYISINFYGIYENYGNEMGISHDEIFQMLYYRYILEKDISECTNDSHLQAFVQYIENLQNGTKKKQDMLLQISSDYPFLEVTVKKYLEYLQLLDKNMLPYEISWTNFCSIEYASDISFQIFTDGGVRKIADGGGYHYIAGKCVEGITTCYSFAASMEYIIDNYDIHLEQEEPVYVIKSDCSYSFYDEVCKEMKKHGYHIYEVLNKKSIEKTISKLPAHSKHIIVGKIEEERSYVQVTPDTRIILK